MSLSSIVTIVLIGIFVIIAFSMVAAVRVGKDTNLIALNSVKVELEKEKQINRIAIVALHQISSGYASPSRKAQTALAKIEALN